MAYLSTSIYPGGNTPTGYYSYYREILDSRDWERVYFIKGGPGTGKSTMMNHIGKFYYSQGESVEYFLCSADPDSLDGVAVGNKVAIFDGTAPHTMDPSLPGINGSILELSGLLDQQILRNNADDIRSINREIGLRYQAAYSYLSVGAEQYRQMDTLSRGIYEEGSLYEAIDLFEYNPVANYGACREHGSIAFISAITSRGLVNNIEQLIGGRQAVILQVPVGYRTHDILETIARNEERQGKTVDRYCCPMMPESTEHIVIREDNRAVVTSNSRHKVQADGTGADTKIIPLREKDYIDIPLWDAYKHHQKKSIKYINKGVDYLREAKMLHDKLENFYIEAMDFSGLDQITQNLIDEIGII